MVLSGSHAIAALVVLMWGGTASVYLLLLYAYGERVDDWDSC